MSAMAEMMLNMLIPKEQQEQVKQLMKPETIERLLNTGKSSMNALIDQQNRIEINQSIIMHHLGLEPVSMEPVTNDSDSDRAGPIVRIGNRTGTNG